MQMPPPLGKEGFKLRAQKASLALKGGGKTAGFDGGIVFRFVNDVRPLRLSEYVNVGSIHESTALGYIFNPSSVSLR